MSFWISKQISVASTLYNLAGPESGRKNYLKGTVFSAVMRDVPSLAESITSSYFKGPGIRQRNFFNYAVRNNLSGLPTATISNNQAVDPIIVGNEIPIPANPPGLLLTVQQADIVDEFEPFIVRHILANWPNRIGEDWLGEFNQATDTLSVQFPNGDFYSWPNNGEYDSTKRYIVARYYTYIDDNSQSWVLGTPVSVTSLAPDIGDYTLDSSTGTFINTLLNRTENVTETFSDGRPDQNYTQPANITVPLNTSVDIYLNRVVVNDTGLGLEWENRRYTYTGTDFVTNDYSNTTVVSEDIGGGVIRTTTTVTTGEQANTRWDEQYDTRLETESQVVGGDQIFIYEVGSGNANLDALVTEADTTGFQEFFPFLPIRLNEKFVDSDDFDNTEPKELYEETKKAWRRATNDGKVQDIIKELAENESIDDIDHAYIVWGVSLNTIEQAGRLYMWRFFEELLQYQEHSPSIISDFQAALPDYEDDVTKYLNWYETDWTGSTNVPPRPDQPKIDLPPQSQFQLTTNSPLHQGTNFDIRIRWMTSQMDQFSGRFTITPPVGNARPARENEVKLEVGPEIEYRTVEGTVNPEVKTRRIRSMYVYYQVSDNDYRRLHIWGMTHHNYIYGGKSVDIDTTEALEDNDPSGFFIPLHNPTVRNMSLVDYTQLATANTHLLLNSYEVVTTNWLLILLVIILVIVIVIATYNPSAAGGAASSAAGAGAASTGGLAGAVRVLNILAKLVDFYVSVAISRMQEDFLDDQAKYEQQMDYIDSLMAELQNDLDFNPLFFTSSMYGNAGRTTARGYTPELPDAFIRRTQMTASDYVELTQGLVYDFNAVKLTLPRTLGDPIV